MGEACINGRGNRAFAVGGAFASMGAFAYSGAATLAAMFAGGAGARAAIGAYYAWVNRVVGGTGLATAAPTLTPNNSC